MPQKLTAKQIRAIYLLIDGCTETGIEETLSLRYQTLKRWKTLPHFIKKLEEAVLETEEAMHRRLMRLADVSIACLRSDLSHYDYDSKRIEMALKVLDKLVSYRQTLPKRRDNDPKRIDNAPGLIDNAPSLDTPPHDINI